MAVRWYLRYPLAYEPVAELLAERGPPVDASCVWRWVQAYAPKLNKCCRPYLKPVNKSYRVDETYIKVKGQEKYLYRAVASAGQTINFLLTAKRDKAAAKCFFRKVFRSPANPIPRVVNVDKNAAYPAAIEMLKRAGMLPLRVRLRQCKFLNNVVEQNHRFVKTCVAGQRLRLLPECPANADNVVLNCSAVVETLFESELFGHVKGAFTGALTEKVGLIEHANGGMLFLDEIGDMPMATQAKLLQAIQNQEVQRVGSLSARKVDVRIVPATHQDLRASIAGKQFREDLFYRLSMIEIRTPSLSERTGDLPLLVHHLIRKFAAQFGKPFQGITPRAQFVLSWHAWPGNVRELENVIGHASMMTLSDKIDVGDLLDYLRTEPNGAADFSAAVSEGFAGTAALSSLDENERSLIREALHRSRGNQSEAARLLKVGRDAFRYKMKKYGIGSRQS